MNRNYYNVTWYTDKELNNYQSKDFRTKREALAFYETHKNDTDKFEFWVTYRDCDDYVLNDIIA